MNATDFLTSNFLAGEDIEPGLRIETAIVSARPHDFKEDGPKLVVYTDYQAKGVVLNQTRLKVLISAWGPNYHNWIGKTIIISRGSTEYAGKKVAAVVIEAVTADRIGADERPVLSDDRDVPPSPDEPDDHDPDDDIPY